MGIGFGFIEMAILALLAGVIVAAIWWFASGKDPDQ